jgi:glycosyl-4,4'-diaponeurosporenoate acyltransferase
MGHSAKKLREPNPANIAQFFIEARRAEIAHWFMLGCLPIFLIWNPPWARCVLAVYALAANLPCILAQRYNRLVLNRIARARCRAFVRL